MRLFTFSFVLNAIYWQRVIEFRFERLLLQVPSYNLIEVFCFSNPNFQTSTQTRNWSKKHFYEQWSFFIRCLFFLSSIQLVFLEWKITNIFLLHSVIVSFIFFMLSNWQLHYTLFRAYFKGSRQGSIEELIRLQQFVSQLGS